MKRKLMSLLLCLCMMLSMLPTAALAVEDEGGAAASAPGCTVTEGCTLPNEHEGACAVEGAEETAEKPAGKPAEDPAGEPEPQEGGENSILPIAANDLENIGAVENEPVTQPEPTGELDLADGSIVITATGYRQGTIEYTGTTYGPDFSIKADGEDVTETAYTGSYTITQSGTASTRNGIRVEGLAAEQSVTLSGVNIADPFTGAGVVIYKNAEVELLLSSENSVKGIASNPGIVVCEGATLTIDGYGALYAEGNSNSSGIGSTNQNQAINTSQQYGSIVINGGDITAKAGSAGAGIGRGYGRTIQSITINGGVVHTNQKYGIYADAVTINGGTMECGTSDTAITATAKNNKIVEVNGGSINGAVPSISDTHTQKRLCFGDGAGNLLTNTQVTVTVGEKSWTAITDENGLLYPYLPNGTEVIAAEAGGNTYQTVSVADSNYIPMGISCVCTGQSGTLAMTTKAQNLTVRDGSITLALASVYTKASDCKLPDGFHQQFEAITYDIEKVVKNGQYMVPGSYAAIEDGTLTAYADSNADSYTVYVRALCGPEGGKVYSESIPISVDTYVPISKENTLDIGMGSITVTAGSGENDGKTVYTQGTTDLAVEANTHVTITGSRTDQIIQVEGGNPYLVFDDLTMDNTNTGNGQTPFVLHAGQTAAIELQGVSTLKGGNMAPGVQINKDATLTILGTGTLNAEGKNDSAGIGAPRHTAYAKNNELSGGNLVIESGIINAMGRGKTVGSSKMPSGIGRSHQQALASVTIHGGIVTAYNPDSKVGIDCTTFAMTDGTLKLRQTSIDVTTANVTGGNLDDGYTGAVAGRKLAELYFVEADGTAVANTEVTVKEGDTTWSALTNEDGVITTYFADATKSVSVSYGSVTDEIVELAEGTTEYLIGGTCTCGSVTGVTWTPGVPAAVTLYGAVSGVYTVAEAKLTLSSECSMPIHPTLTPISYGLTVEKDDAAVSGDAEDYATLENGMLTLKHQNAPYTVTLTAEAGDNTATHTVAVTKATAEAAYTFDLSAGKLSASVNNGGQMQYQQGSGAQQIDADGAGVLVTGTTSKGEIALTSGTPKLQLAQIKDGAIWTVTTESSVTAATLDVKTVNGRIYFGASGVGYGQKGYLSAETIKINPENGDIVLMDTGFQQGSLTATGLAVGAEYRILGASQAADRTISNSTEAAITLNVNGESVTIDAGESYTVARAINVSRASSACAYLLPNGESIYKIVVVGENTTAGLNRFDTSTQQPLVQSIYYDPDFESLQDQIIYGTKIKSLSIDHAKYIGMIFYVSPIENIHLGAQVESISRSNYTSSLKSITVDSENKHYKTVDGILYTADGKLLVWAPSRKSGEYTIPDSCVRIGDFAFSASSLTSLTLGAGIASIGSRAFESAKLKSISVVPWNVKYSAVDGVLYSKDGKTLVLYLSGKQDSEFVIPEGVTAISSMAFYQQKGIKSLTLPSTITTIGEHGLADMTALETVHINFKSADALKVMSGNTAIKTVTLAEGYNYSLNLFGKMGANTVMPMQWLSTDGIKVIGQDTHYDGQPHGVTVTATASNVTVEYNTDGETYSAEKPTFTEPGTYRVYYCLTKAADYVPASEGKAASGYNFAREAYSSCTITIQGIQADASWFSFTAGKLQTATNIGTGADVTLAQPVAAPSLENGYTVRYTPSGGEATTEIPTTTGAYLVTVDIDAVGYRGETLTLGYYTILASEQSESKIISFITSGGSPVEPIVALVTEEIETPTAPTRDGYSFAGWYSDAALRDKVEPFPTTMPAEGATYYAKWTRDTYAITYTLNEGTDGGNPKAYHVQTPTFTLLPPTRPGYRFTGWTWEGQTAPQTAVIIPSGSFGDKAYAANWEELHYTIAYQNYAVGEKDSYTAAETSSGGISLTTPASRQGYQFVGWLMEATGTAYVIAADDAEIPQGTMGDLVLSGIWLAENQTLTLDANGGSFEDGAPTRTVTAGYASSITLSQPTRSGYTFAGWYTDSALTIPFSAASMPLTATIYAKWSIIPTGGNGSGGASTGKAQISSNQGGTVTAEKDGTVTITPDNGYRIKNVTVNGISKGAVTSLSGLKQTDVVSVVFEKMEAKVFADVADTHWAKNEIDYCVSRGLFAGTSETTFSPEAPMTRAMLMVVLARMNGQDTAGGSVWYEKGMSWAKDNGISDGTNPNGTITREQLVTMLWRYAGSPAATGSLSGFTDAGSVADYAKQAMAWAVENGIVSGTSATTLSPKGNATRAQLAAILTRFDKKFGEE